MKETKQKRKEKKKRSIDRPMQFPATLRIPIEDSLPSIKKFVQRYDSNRIPSTMDEREQA